MHESGWISSDTADQAKSEYKAFVTQAIVTEFAIFDIYSDRIAMVWGKLMQSQTHLWEAVKLCLFHSYGNAHVESGFSTNEQILDHNLKETSLVAHGVQSEGGVLKVDINKKLLLYVQRAHAEYSHALEENKKMQMAGEKWKQEQCRLNNKLKNTKRSKTEPMTAHGKEMNKY